jgi:hypothetical protein
VCILFVLDNYLISVDETVSRDIAVNRCDFVDKSITIYIITLLDYFH